MSNSPSKSTRINGNLIVETYGNSLYHCNYKSTTIEYPDLRVNETTGFASNLNGNYRNGTDQSQDHDVSFDIIDDIIEPICLSASPFTSNVCFSVYSRIASSLPCFTVPSPNI